MTNLAHKLYEPQTAIEGALDALQNSGFKIMSREEEKREAFLERNRALKRCEPWHEKVFYNHRPEAPVCLDCDPWFRGECGRCGAKHWECCC